jgi:hypothetical protein
MKLLPVACFFAIILATTNSVFAQQASAEKLPTNRKANKITTKPTVLKTTPPPKGEGYWVEPTPVPVENAAPPPPAKVYTEVQTSVTEDGRLFLTSDTVIVRPEVKVKTVTAPVAPIESTGDQKLDEIIQNAAQKHQIDPRLVLEVVRQESGFRLRAVSHKGAQGLMQLMPATAARFGVVNSYDPAENVQAGTKYLRFLLDTFGGDLELALAGYNAGENAVIRNNYKIPNYRETRDYVRSITARYRSKFHQVTTVTKKAEPPKIQRVAVMTLTAEDGRTVLSNNY